MYNISSTHHRSSSQTHAWKPDLCLEAHFVNYFPVQMEESYSAAEIQTLE